MLVAAIELNAPIYILHEDYVTSVGMRFYCIQNSFDESYEKVKVGNNQERSQSEDNPILKTEVKKH